jgi:hypothetical protein
MKKLLLTSALMAFAASAQAAVTVDPISCDGIGTGISCSAPISCVGQCNTQVAPGTLNCTPFPPNGAANPAEDVDFLIANKEGIGDPVCIWQVIDTDGGLTVVTIDSSDGLPVELQSLSVE